MSAESGKAKSRTPRGLTSNDVPRPTPEEVERRTNPWILMKIKALGELMPEAGLRLETELDDGRDPHQISLLLFQQYNVRLSDLEVARYGAWLPELRRNALRRAEEKSERLVAEARQRMKVGRR